MSDLATCYHCGLLVDEASERWAQVAGERRLFCCAGCQAVATLIHEGGLSRYYERREQLPQVEQDRVSTSEAEWLIYDDPLVQSQFVHRVDEDIAEASLSIEGIRCAACVWLNEQHLMRQSGVLSVHINHSTQRMRIRWNPKRIELSRIFSAITQIGYRAMPFHSDAKEARQLQERRHALFRLAVAWMGMMQVMMYAWPVYFSTEAIDPEHQKLLNGVSFLLTLPVVLYSAAPMYRSAWRSVVNRHIGMDVPVVLGISAAFIASCVALMAGHGAVYFDSVSMFVGLLLAARYVEMRMRQQARSSAEQVVSHLPAVSQRWTTFPEGQPEQVASLHIVAGDFLYIKAGEVFPCDAHVMSGESEAEEALLTGESRPIPKKIGDTVLAGSYNFSSPLVVKVTQIGEGTRLAEMARLLDHALAHRSRVAELADQVASWFVMALLGLSACVAVFWAWHDPSRALMVTVSVLVVSCPCALSLATPAALAAATGALARFSLLILGRQTLETLAQVTDVVMDKTGTLTTGHFALVETRCLGSLSSAFCLKMAEALASGSEHPLAKQLRQTSSQSLKLFPNDLKHVSGMGMEGMIEGQVWRMGRYEFVQRLSSASSIGEAYSLECEASLSTVWLANVQGVQAVFLFADTARKGAAAFVQAMKDQGKRVHLLSGDRGEAVQFWAKQWGIECWHAHATPLDKQDYVKRLQAKGAVVAMLGDGINDAPVLGTAQVSLTLAGGTPLAKVGADVVLMSDSLEALPLVFSMAQRTRRVIWQNLCWAFAYNLIAIPLAASGALTPLAAGLGMSLSSLCVVLNACRLVRI